MTLSSAQSSPSRGLFVTGTDTEIGKTWVSVGLMYALQGAGLTALGMKPVSAGCEPTSHGLRNGDAVRLQQAGSVPVAYEAVNRYAFEPPVSPHVAAAAAGVEIDLEAIAADYAALAREAQWVVVEGVGGWYAPLGEEVTVAEMASRLGLPLVLVVGLRLGCLNHALLTARAIEAAGLTLAGWVATELSTDMAAAAENVHYLRRALAAPLLGVVPHLQRFDPARIAASLDLSPLLR